MSEHAVLRTTSKMNISGPQLQDLSTEQIVDGVILLRGVLLQNTLQKKRRTWLLMEKVARPVPKLIVDIREPTDFFAWCRHHRVELYPTYAVAPCSLPFCGRYPGIPLNITRVRLYGEPSIIDMTAYEPQWGMPVHVALDRLIKIDNAISMMSCIYEGPTYLTPLVHSNS